MSPAEIARSGAEVEAAIEKVTNWSAGVAIPGPGSYELRIRSGEAGGWLFKLFTCGNTAEATAARGGIVCRVPPEAARRVAARIELATPETENSR